ncbi:hypothetical protein G3M83_09295 [Rouxiella badensis]|uniref:hypothetical protein n=1 Tax=Rouxiella badensis TaxID=1646377 RepID=UPI0013EF29D0|nr:hypothetical protein [Rouxiella badensis]QII37879.1 hypothetical protein G3M83_09295 [Rouxiella badensis]
MGNFSIHAGLINGGLMPIMENEKSSGEVVTAFTGDDTGVPVTSLTVTVHTDSGKIVEIVVPNSSATAIVKVDGNII